MNLSNLPIDRCRDLSTTNNFDDAEVYILGIPLYNMRRTDYISPSTLMRVFSDKLEDSMDYPGIYISNLKVYDLGEISSYDYSQFEVDIASIINKIYSTKKMAKLLFIGGDHLITYQLVKLIKPELIIVFDAHLDLKDSYMFNKFNNATVFRRVLEWYRGPILYFGPRAFDENEMRTLSENDNIHLNDFEILNRYIDVRTYISIDIDVLDPSIIRQVTYPEPDGWRISRLIDVLEKVSKKLNVMAGDIVEYNPRRIDIAEISSILKLTYHMSYFMSR